MITEQLFIGGRWRAAQATLPVEDPSTGEEIGTLAAGAATDVDAAVTAAETALSGSWGALTAAERGRLLAKIGRAVEAKAEVREMAGAGR